MFRISTIILCIGASFFCVLGIILSSIIFRVKGIEDSYHGDQPIQPINKHDITTGSKESNRDLRAPDAFFAGHPVSLVHGQPPHARVQCLSENFQNNSWMYRSW